MQVIGSTRSRAYRRFQNPIKTGLLQLRTSVAVVPGRQAVFNDASQLTVSVALNQAFQVWRLWTLIYAAAPADDSFVKLESLYFAIATDSAADNRIAQYGLTPGYALPLISGGEAEASLVDDWFERDDMNSDSNVLTFGVLANVNNTDKVNHNIGVDLYLQGAVLELKP